jgi:hypothetical protein
MEMVTCRVGDTIRPATGIRIVIESHEGSRIGLRVTVPCGTSLRLDDAAIQPQSGTVGVWSFVFSLHALRTFEVGLYFVRFWLPGELEASTTTDAIDVGILELPSRSHQRTPSDWFPRAGARPPATPSYDAPGRVPAPSWERRDGHG